MTEPVSFGSSTSRYQLPLLFSGQAQKEFYVNGAISSLDLLVHTTVSGLRESPPASPGEDEVWLVSTNPQGDWIGHVEKIARFSSGAWRFINPRPGMRIFNDETGQFLHFDTTWKAASSPASPQGGATIDVEARGTIDELIALLQDSGILRRA